MRGRQGIGKGTIAKILKRIIGRHFVHLSNHKHLTGNHNAHLMYALLAFCDEAFFAGDRAATGELKRIVTEETRMIEPKFVDAFEIRNYMRVLMATNRVLAMIEAVALLEIPAMSLALH
jgi:phage/plasmid-associated DNA primase